MRDSRMFEQELENMCAVITIENALYDTLTASNVGISDQVISRGSRVYTFFEAIESIKAIEKALKGCPKYLKKRIQAQKMSFIFAFGPEMEKYIRVVDVTQNTSG